MICNLHHVFLRKQEPKAKSDASEPLGSCFRRSTVGVRPLGHR